MTASQSSLQICLPDIQAANIFPSLLKVALLCLEAHHSIPSQPLPAWTFDTRQDPWIYEVNIPSEMEICHVSQLFHSSIIHFFCSHMSTLTLSSCSWLSGVEPSMVLCCCSPSTSRVSELYIQRCPSAHNCCNELLFVYLWPLCVQLEIAWPFF